MDSYIKRQYELRAQAWEAAKAVLDTAAAEARDLTSEEEQAYQRANTEMDERTSVIERLEADKAREARAAEMRIAEEPAPRESGDLEILRRMVSGEVRSHTFESRALATTTTDAGVVPQDFLAQIQEQLVYTGPALEPGVYNIIRTGSGNDIKVPVQSTFSQATATAEGAVFTESNPTTTSLTLRAHKYGVLVQTSRELLEESGIDLQAFLAREIGVAIGTAINTVLTTGTGTVQPRGIVVAAGSGVTGGTGVTGAFTANNLIDLAHSVDAAVARRPGVGWMMNRTALGALRKLTDVEGAYLYNPVVGGAEQLLGYRVIQNPGMASPALSAKSVLFGDFSSYLVRVVNGIEIARSDDYAFNQDIITWRASIRVDGDLGQSANIKYFIGNAA
jgi:HK97 family phage major capsid protein